MSDQQLADQIKEDKVDILIDLSGHSSGNRLRVFARKPAPVQVTAWGHATGTGLPVTEATGLMEPPGGVTRMCTSLAPTCPGEIVTEEIAARIEDAGIERVKIMSPLTSTSQYGIDGKSYGINPATNRVAKIGDSVGIIAAQSIGEPGTQLTMRTFHIGGVASGGFKTPEIRVRSTGRVKYKGLRLVPTADGASIVLNKTGTIQILDAEEKELETYNIVVGSYLPVSDGEKIEKGSVLAQWDPYNVPVLSEKGGTLVFKDMIPGVTVKRELDESSGRIATIVIEHKEDLNPQIEIRDEKGKPLAAYSIPVGAQIAVNEGDIITPGALLAKTPREIQGTQDITGGLPRVTELFEARRPKDPAVLASALGRGGEGRICAGRVFRVQAPLPVYRVWDGAKANTYGEWWALEPPRGDREDYRRAYAVCPEGKDP